MSADRQAEAALYKQYEARIRRAVLAIPASSRWRCTVEELVQAGMGGLARAMRSFDPAKARPGQTSDEALKAYAAEFIQGDIKRRLVQEKRIPERLLSKVLESDPDRSEQRWTTWAENLGAARMLTVLTQSQSAQTNETPEDALIRKESDAELRRARSALSEREQFLIEQHYDAGQPLVAIAAAIGVHNSVITKNLKKALERLREQLEEQSQVTGSTAQAAETAPPPRRRKATIKNLLLPRRHSHEEPPNERS